MIFQIENKYLLLLKQKSTPNLNELINKTKLYLTNSIDGLQNLKFTYNDDSVSKNKLDKLIEKIQMIIKSK